MAAIPPLVGPRTDKSSVPDPHSGPAPKLPEKHTGDGIDVGRHQPTDALAVLATSIPWTGSAASDVAGAAGALGAAAVAGAASGLAAGAIPISAGNAGEDAPNAAWRHASHAVAHPPESNTSVTPARTEPRSTVGSSTPAKSGVELPNHTGHASGPPQASPVHVSPAHATSGIGTTTTPNHEVSAHDQATFKTAGEVQALNPGSVIEKQTWTKRTPEATERLRRKFEATDGPRAQFVKDLANKHGGDLEAAGLSEPDIARMREGAVPLKWSVHHRQPLAQGGSNAPENLILIRQNANHASLTGLQNTRFRLA